MVAVFLDLTDFTGRTFRDDQEQTADLAHAVLTGLIQVVTDFGDIHWGFAAMAFSPDFRPGIRHSRRSWPAITDDEEHVDHAAVALSQTPPRNMK